MREREENRGKPPRLSDTYTERASILYYTIMINDENAIKTHIHTHTHPCTFLPKTTQQQNFMVSSMSCSYNTQKISLI